MVVVVMTSVFAIANREDDSIDKKFRSGAFRVLWLGFIIRIIAIFGYKAFAYSNLSKIGLALAVCP